MYNLPKAAAKSIDCEACDIGTKLTLHLGESEDVKCMSKRDSSRQTREPFDLCLTWTFDLYLDLFPI